MGISKRYEMRFARLTHPSPSANFGLVRMPFQKGGRIVANLPQQDRSLLSEHPLQITEVVGEDKLLEVVENLALELSRHYEALSPVVMLGILKGSFIFIADLARRMSVETRIEFISASSYERGVPASSPRIKLLCDRNALIGTNLLVVDTLIDSGRTMNAVVRETTRLRPKSIMTCALLRKRKSSHDHIPDFLGIEVEDSWMVGYGLDYDQGHRSLTFIGKVANPL